MKIWYCLAAILSLTGCYTQLYTGGYAERTVYPYPYDRDASPRDSAAADSLDSVAAADTLRHPKTVIVNNYYDNSPYYRGYSIDAWDYPFVSLGFYSGRYRDYYDPYWWSDGRPNRGHRRYYQTYPGGGTTQGHYHSDQRIFPPASSQPPLHKGRRSEPAQPAAKPAAPAPAPAQSTAPDESSRSSSDNGNSSSNSSGSSSGSSGGSSDDQHDLHKGRR